MNYISVEQFQEQPKEVQKVFLDWWKPSKGDIFVFLGDNTSRKIGVLGDGEDIKITTKGKGEYRLPLLTESQLREFIEDKADYKIDSSFYHKSYDLDICEKDSGLYITTHEDLGADLFQAYWKVACSVAKGEEQ